jgi:hypothetical protein
VGTLQHLDADQRLTQQAAGACSRVTFFTVCNDKYFPGLVGLVNSLRLMGHDDPVVVGDCGLTAAQREALAPLCRLFKLDSSLVRNPTQYKPFPFLLHPQGIVVMIDSDMIVTKSLNPVLALAAQGKICAFPDPEHDRWFSEWQEIFSLPSVPRKQTYVCAGFVAFSASLWPDLLELWWEACQRIRGHPTLQEGVPSSGATAQGDQDALNALLMSEFPFDALLLLPDDEQVYIHQLRQVRSADARTLRCQYKGQQLLILHACCTPKPWQPNGVCFRGDVRGDVYLRFLRRLLSAPDVALKVPTPLLKIWLRQGVVADLVCFGRSFANLFKSRAISLVGRLGFRQ